MKFRLSFLLACFLTCSCLAAKDFPAASSPQSHQSQNSPCPVAAPNDLHMVEQGPTSVTLEWTPIIDALQHRIKIYRASDNFLLQNILVPAGVTILTVDNLPVATNMYGTISSVCESGDESAPSESYSMPALILDLIVVGYSPATIRDCSITAANQECTFPGDGTVRTFEVFYNNERRKFGVTLNLSTGHWQVNLGESNANQKFKLYCDASTSPDCFETPAIFVTYEATLGGPAISIGKFELKSSVGSNMGIFKSIWMASGTVFNRLKPLAPPTGGKPYFIGGLDALSSENLELAFASPNPFANVLDVFPGRPEAQNIQLQLFNLSGQKVLDQQFGGGMEQYTLSTEGLASGFYLLRIEADGEVQTLKVIKSE